MTSQYNAGTPGAPLTALPGFGPAPTSYPTPELQECATFLSANYPVEFQRNEANIMGTLKNLQEQRFLDPRDFAAGVLAATRGIEVLSAERGLVPAQSGQAAPPAGADPYRPAAKTPPPTLTTPVDLNRLAAAAPNYADALRQLNVKPEIVDEYLSRFGVGSGPGQELTLERARARWVANAVKGDVNTDLKVLETPVFGVDG